MGILPKADHDFWVTDEQVTHCSDCRIEFCFTKRRHHCRCCGEVYCGDCTSQKALVMPANEIEKHYTVKEKRVCDGCASIYKSIRLGGAPCEYLLGGTVDASDRLYLRYEDSSGLLYKEGMNAQRRWIGISEESTTLNADCSYCLKPLDSQVSQYNSSEHQRTCHHMLHFSCALQHDSVSSSSSSLSSFSSLSFKSNLSSKSKHCPCCCTSYDYIKPCSNPYLESDVESTFDSIIPENGVTYFLVDVKQRAVFRMPTGFVVAKPAPRVYEL